MKRLLAIVFLLAFPASAQQVFTPSQNAIACAYNTSLPTLTAGVYGLVQCDSAGHLLAGAPAYAASGKTPVTGTFAATGQSSSFTPLGGRGFNISLWGTFVATVQLERSFDSGTTWLPLTAAGTQLYKWTAPASESAQEDEVPVLYRLNATAYTSGTVNYRISQ